MMAENGLYGRELPIRAHQLLDELGAFARKISAEGPSTGSLYPTFLLTMATPIIIQPYERFFAGKGDQSERIISEFDGYPQYSGLATALKDLKSRQSLDGTPMGVVEWKFAFLKASSDYKLADGINPELQYLLKDPKAIDMAKRKSPKNILEHLRHAMAHGTIIYLDADINPALYGGAEFFLFANARTKGKVDFLLISVSDFKKFISSWAEWLKEPK